MNTNDLIATERGVVDLPHHCNGCTNRWNGRNTCHCYDCRDPSREAQISDAPEIGGAA